VSVPDTLKDLFFIEKDSKRFATSAMGICPVRLRLGIRPRSSPTAAASTAGPPVPHDRQGEDYNFHRVQRG